MDQKKIDEIVKNTRPGMKVAGSDEYSHEAQSDSKDVDVSGLSATTWKKFRSSMETAVGSDVRDDSRERFRPRKLTGAGPARPRPDGGAHSDAGAQTRAGKLVLERLVPEDNSADGGRGRVVDVLIDEVDGIIGESDSRPLKK